ncbi:MAG: Ig-like domain-containing protein [Bacteroidales bacterium]|nr:Ig-like domain-containing protein [Bacteroidales bacterium]
MKKFLVFLVTVLLIVACEPKEVAVTSVTVTPSAIELTEGEGAASLSAKVLPENAIAPVSWTSSDTGIAAVSQSGVVTPLKAGTATVTATAGEKSGTCKVTVKARIINVTGVTLNKTEMALTVGDEETLEATVAPENATNKNVRWKSSDADVATVDNVGKVTAVMPGEATITVTTEDGCKTASCQVTVSKNVKSALRSIYDSLGGADWIHSSESNKKPWFSTDDISEWEYLEVESGKVVDLQLFNVGAYGTIPPEIGELTDLETLIIDNYQGYLEDPLSKNISGSLPDELGDLVNLKQLWIRGTNIENTFGPKLTSLIVKLMDTFKVDSYTQWGAVNFVGNRLSGELPKAIWEHPLFHFKFGVFTEQQTGYGFNSSSFSLKGPYYTVKDINGNSLNLGDITKRSKYTLFIYYNTNTENNLITLDYIREAYKQYHNSGLEVVGQLFSEKVPKYDLQDNEYDIWSNYYYDKGGIVPQSYPLKTPAAEIVDSEGHVVFTWRSMYGLDHTDERYNRDACTELIPFLESKFGPINKPEDRQYYESTDYSADGRVTKMQTATVGQGIDLVIMGDAYADVDIKEGKFKTAAEAAVDAFFEIEPYKSFRDRFNVYAVDVVSKNNAYSKKTATKFATWFDETGASMAVGGNDDTVIEYIKKAVGTRWEKATAIVLLNTRRDCGTTYFYWDNPDLGICYLPANTAPATCAETLQHEACGHAFGKLQDEYSYQENGMVPDIVIENIRVSQQKYGWYVNVDFTNDTSKILWAKFIADSRYDGEKLGAYQGGLTFWKGVYRPTENSIMRDNTSGFNAPSREAIYKRINSMADPQWKYDYEEFVKYDAVNRNYPKAEGAVKSVKPVNKKKYCPPVIAR